jgi:hypothetical protein
MPEDGAAHITVPFSMRTYAYSIYGVTCTIKIVIKTIVPSISV